MGVVWGQQVMPLLEGVVNWQAKEGLIETGCSLGISLTLALRGCRMD